MTQQNSSRFGTAFTETIEAREGVTTGISAADRAHTIRTAIDPKATSPIWPVPATSFRYARAAAASSSAPAKPRHPSISPASPASPAGVICEIMRDDGEMARIPDLIPFCKQHGLRILTVADLIRHRLRHERYIVRAGESRNQTRYGEFRMIAYESQSAAARATSPSSAAAVPQLPRLLPSQASRGPGTRRRATRPRNSVPLARMRCSLASTPVAPPAKSSPPTSIAAEILDHSMRMIAEDGYDAILYLHDTSHGFEIDEGPARCLRARGRGRFRRAPRGAREPAAWSSTRRCEPGGLPGPDGARPARHQPRSPNPVGSRRPAHPPALEHAHAHPRPRRLRPRIVEQVPIPVEECRARLKEADLSDERKPHRRGDAAPFEGPAAMKPPVAGGYFLLDRRRRAGQTF